MKILIKRKKKIEIKKKKKKEKYKEKEKEWKENKRKKIRILGEWYNFTYIMLTRRMKRRRIKLSKIIKWSKKNHILENNVGRIIFIFSHDSGGDKITRIKEKNRTKKK